MRRIDKTVFVSYRRTDEAWALPIFQDLTQHGYDVFIDYDGIASGNFETIILENIRARAHFLVLLTPTALERCTDPKDWMRREIEAALDSRRNIVPVMLEGFDFSKSDIAGQLTGELAALKELNGLEIPKARFFSSEMERLRTRFLNVPVDAVLHPASDSAQEAASEQKGKATIALRAEEAGRLGKAEVAQTAQVMTPPDREATRLFKLTAFDAIWNPLALTLFAAMFYLFLANRRTVEGQPDILSPFWGLHVYAFLAPVVSCLWFIHAGHFKLYDWVSRVPRFPAMPIERGSFAAKISAALTLFFFVLSPLYIEGHFVDVFYTRGKVYIYPDQFGFKPEELKDCIPRDTPLCPHPEAGRYSTVKPRPPATGGYWDNAYHYGGDKNGTTVTFFPILQPVVLHGLALVATLIQIAALFRTFWRGDWSPFRTGTWGNPRKSLNGVVKSSPPTGVEWLAPDQERLDSSLRRKERFRRLTAIGAVGTLVALAIGFGWLSRQHRAIGVAPTGVELSVPRDEPERNAPTPTAPTSRGLAALTPDASCLNGNYINTYPGHPPEMAWVDGCDNGWQNCHLHDQQPLHWGTIKPMKDHPDQWIISGPIGDGYVMTVSKDCKSVSFSHGATWMRTP